MATVTMERKETLAKEVMGSVHCPMCTHTVSATVIYQPRSVHVKPGQKCGRCASALDAAFVLRFERAA
jgi:uncharacterized protein (UPF0212 family)